MKKHIFSQFFFNPFVFLCYKVFGRCLLLYRTEQYMVCNGVLTPKRNNPHKTGIPPVLNPTSPGIFYPSPPPPILQLFNPLRLKARIQYKNFLFNITILSTNKKKWKKNYQWSCNDYSERYISVTFRLKCYHINPANIRLQNTNSRRPDQDEYICLGHTSLRRLQDVLQKLLQDIFKTSSRRIANMSSRYLQDVSSS